MSNHLKSAFSKLGVHSQAELIELARSEPRRLGLEEEVSGRSQLALAELEQRCVRARDRLIARVETAYVGPPALSQLREAVREALPLDPGELLAATGALALGAGARLLGNTSEASAEKELHMLDTFVDSLGTSGRT